MLVKAKGQLQSIAASRLADGLAVWLAVDFSWVESVAEAAVFDREEIPRIMERTQADIAARLVVDVYPIDVEIRNGAPVPLHLRERIKALGPSIHPELGHQAARPASFSP